MMIVRMMMMLDYKDGAVVSRPSQRSNVGGIPTCVVSWEKLQGGNHGGNRLRKDVKP